MLVGWLGERREELAEMLVVVPTGQCGRRLREALAEELGGVLSPRVVTPGALLRDAAESGNPAADWLEVLAWREVLLGARDWDDFAELIPAPEEAGERAVWASGLARQMVAVRRSLQENGLRLAGAARRMEESPEAARWQALARLEEEVERWLRERGWVSRSEVLSRTAVGAAHLDGYRRIVLAAVPDMSPLVERMLEAAQVPVDVLIAAAEDEAENFTKLGRPLEEWSGRVFDWPDGENGPVRLAADPREQGRMVAEVLAEGKRASDEVAVGSADAATGEEIARMLDGLGWTCFHPAAPPRVSGLRRWLHGWSAWLAEPRLGVLQDLLALPETGAFCGGGNRRVWLAGQLAMLRERWLAELPADLEQWLEDDGLGRKEEREAAEEVLGLARGLESWRGRIRREGFAFAMKEMLARIAESNPEQAVETVPAMELLDAFAAAPEDVRVPDGVWMELLLENLPPELRRPPDGRVIDVQGWLELFHEPGGHLVIAGMNEGSVPVRAAGDPWLGEGARRLLGLTSDARRAARDAYLLHAMCAARAEGGRVDLICGKTTAEGNPLLPSRLLLVAPPEELPARVEVLFASLEPPEAGLHQVREWRWQPRHVTPAQRVPVTSLADYLRCPFRYYLKHVLRMGTTEPDRGEWNARDFGNITHAVLEAWGRDEEARDEVDPERIAAYVNARLDSEVGRRFGKRPPLAVRLQVEAMRQRLRWFAEAQAAVRAEGWRVYAIEHKIEVEMDGLVLVGKIDRIDHHERDGCWRVIDYKTGNVKSVADAHLGSITKLPAHLKDTAAMMTREKQLKTKTTTETKVWKNLQLPFYAHAWAMDHAGEISLAYFPLPAKQSEVELATWEGFGEVERDSAAACTRHVVECLNRRLFWPPAEKPDYDDYPMLAADALMEDTVRPPDEWRAAVENEEEAAAAEVEEEEMVETDEWEEVEP